ncbi:MAG: hypothetical protein V9H69_10340 [Anaerolineae bacterium]
MLPMPWWATAQPASCTEAAFDAALATASNGGGTITFNCGPGREDDQLHRQQDRQPGQRDHRRQQPDRAQSRQ